MLQLFPKVVAAALALIAPDGDHDVDEEPEDEEDEDLLEATTGVEVSSNV